MGRLFEPKPKIPLHTKFNWFIGATYFVCVLGIMILVGLAIYASVNTPNLNTTNNHKIITDHTAIFAVILAGLTITLASSIIIPKVLLKFEVESQLSQLKLEFKKEFKEEVLPKFLTENKVTDAHLSRMIGYTILHQSNFTKKKSESEHLYQLTWSIGWALRSYKRYIEASEGESITGEDISLENYDDLISINHETMSRASIQILKIANKCKTIQKFHSLIFDSSNGQEINNRNLAQLYRTIKETVDIDHEINYLQQQPETKSRINHNAERQVKRWLKSVSPITSLIIATCFYHLSEIQKNDNAEAMDLLLEEIKRRSNFKKDETFVISLKEGLIKCKSSIGNEISEATLKGITNILEINHISNTSFIHQLVKRFKSLDKK